MQIAARDIAQMLGGTLEGNADALVSRPGRIEDGGAGTLTFLTNAKYEEYAYRIPSSVLIAGDEFSPNLPLAAEALIRVPDVYDAFRVVLQKFAESNGTNGTNGIASNAFVHPVATLGQAVSVGAFSVIEQGAVVGDGTHVGAQVFIGEAVRIGKHCVLHPGVKIYQHCEIGDHCIIHANAVIGGDGFGFAPQNDGAYRKIPQIGNVVIEDDVEIGANTTIDRATMGSTIIRRGVKLDNLIMVAHNVEIGEHTAIAAQTGIAGSTRIGRRCRIGGQSGFVGHITIADGTQVQAQSGVTTSIVQENTAVYGSPALPYTQFLRAYALFRKLPELIGKIMQQPPKKP